jgi:glycosyltransferase involved in cell wall biosynthesis
MQMYISVIIPTYNRNDLLEKCLDALAPKTQQIFNYEVIVTDDSQTCEAKKLIDEKFQWVQWIEGPHKGSATNRNNGAKQACGEWLVFVDDDCIPDRNLIKCYSEAINTNSNILTFEGCIKANRPKCHFLEESPINETGGYFWSCNIMIQKNYFMNQLKGFDENFPYPAMEDIDLRERIKKDNQTILFVKNAFVVHPWRLQNDPLDIAKKRYLSYLYLCSKHPEFIKKPSFPQKIKNELRFYIKNVLFKIPQYRGRGVIKYIQAHLLSNLISKQNQKTVKFI